MLSLKVLGDSLSRAFLLASGVAGSPCHPLVCRRILPVSASAVLCLFSPCVSVCLLLFLQGNWVYWIRTYPSPVGPHVNLMTSAKTLFSNRITFTGIGGEDRQYVCEGACVNPQQGPKSSNFYESTVSAQSAVHGPLFCWEGSQEGRR